MTTYQILRRADDGRYRPLTEWGIYLPIITSRETAQEIIAAARAQGDVTDLRIATIRPEGMLHRMPTAREKDRYSSKKWR